MEEWGVVADRMRLTLLGIADGTKTFDFLRIVKAAYLKLATNARITHSVLNGATVLELDAIPRPPPEGYSPLDLIERARVAFEILRGDHATAGRIFVLYGTRVGLLEGDGDPLWRTWEGHHATATQEADEALQGLHEAAASGQAMVDALEMATSLPPGSPAWLAWVSAARSHTLCAVSGVTTAAVTVRLMRRAVLPEYIAACNVLYR